MALIERGIQATYPRMNEISALERARQVFRAPSGRAVFCVRGPRRQALSPLPDTHRQRPLITRQCASYSEGLRSTMYVRTVRGKHSASVSQKYKYMCVCSVVQSCPTVCSPMDCSPPGSSVHGISQARVLEWVAISFSTGSSQSRDQAHISCTSCISRQILYHCVN